MIYLSVEALDILSGALLVDAVKTKGRLLIRDIGCVPQVRLSLDLSASSKCLY